MANKIQRLNEPITGKVAGVLNERELTINIGSTNGVRTGMIFKVLAESPLEVMDPDSKEVLGTIDREKVQVKVSEVSKKYAICRTFRHRTIGNLGMPALFPPDFFPMFKPSYRITDTLKAADSALPPPLSEKESYVRTGDRVVQIIDDDE